jgi:GxxExxY protein
MADSVHIFTEPSEEVDRLANRVIGAAIEVHRELGAGFMESIYEEALCVELELRGIPFVRQAPMNVMFKSHSVGTGRIDILVGGVLVVELKAVELLAPIHKAQVRSYLKATGCKLGLLLNFNSVLLKDGAIKRIILS